MVFRSFGFGELRNDRYRCRYALLQENQFDFWQGLDRIHQIRIVMIFGETC